MKAVITRHPENDWIMRYRVEAFYASSHIAVIYRYARTKRGAKRVARSMLDQLQKEVQPKETWEVTL